MFIQLITWAKQCLFSMYSEMLKLNKFAHMKEIIFKMAYDCINVSALCSLYLEVSHICSV